MSARLNPEKLLLSKWTTRQVVAREKHFLVVELLREQAPTGELGAVDAVVLEAVLTKRQRTLKWRELTDSSAWRQGWQ